ncbi:MAG: hypothetical protein WBB25_20250 [Sulfitobacter sp.]
MTIRPILRLCLEPVLLKSAAAGEHNFVNLLIETVEKSRFRVEFCPDTEAELFKPVSDNVYTLAHMIQPPSGRGLVFRRAYHYPFWQIDSTAERWKWDVAKATFNQEEIPQKEAQRFAAFWKKRLFGNAPVQADRRGYVYVPLQGKISMHRTFQSCSPLEMLTQTLIHCDGREVVATLHPKEIYTGAERAALDQLDKRYSHLTIDTGNMEKHLLHCDYVVTQNSSAAFAGYFFGKPALLFAGIDFHHIAVRADMNNLALSFAEVALHEPGYPAYIWWFWQHQSINAGKDDAVTRIAARFRRFGWPIE